MNTLTHVQQTALALLARREHSRQELKRKLQNKGFDAEAITAVLVELEKHDWQSDDRFAESFVRSRIIKGYGPLRIMQDLQQRGVSGEIIERFVDPHDAEWSNLIEQVRQKKFGSLKPKKFSEQAKQARFLQYRGFSTEQIRTIELL